MGDNEGALDETHPLAFGVVGVHGKPGLEHAAALVETAELVLSFGIDDQTLLICNKAGLQTRTLIEVGRWASVAETTSEPTNSFSPPLACPPRVPPPPLKRFCARPLPPRSLRVGSFLSHTPL